MLSGDFFCISKGSMRDRGKVGYRAESSWEVGKFVCLKINKRQLLAIPRCIGSRPVLSFEICYSSKNHWDSECLFFGSVIFKVWDTNACNLKDLH